VWSVCSDGYKRCMGAATNLLALILYSNIRTGVLYSKLVHTVAVWTWHSLCALRGQNTNTQKCWDYYTAPCHNPQPKQTKQYRLLTAFYKELNTALYTVWPLEAIVNKCINVRNQRRQNLCGHHSENNQLHMHVTLTALPLQKKKLLFPNDKNRMLNAASKIRLL
jgi:hypothetical protein